MKTNKNLEIYKLLEEKYYEEYGYVYSLSLIHI